MTGQKDGWFNGWSVAGQVRREVAGARRLVDCLYNISKIANFKIKNNLF
jgi:hypothetical protein